MIRFVQQLVGNYDTVPLIPNNDTLTTEDHQVSVSGQEPDSDTKAYQSHSVTHSKLSSKSVTPQGSSTGETEHSDQSLPSNYLGVEQGVGTTFQNAHHFSIDGKAQITNIGQQFNNINWGTSGLDNLKKLVAPNALHDSSAQDPKRCCYPGTRQRVLDQMGTWIDDPSRRERILWLHGPAGIGKSAIAQTISNSYGQDKIGATFFFYRSDPSRNDGYRLPPTLAWQLASSVPIVEELIASSLEKYPDLPEKSIEIQFKKLITEPFLTIFGNESTAPIYMRVIVIDGLDECSDVELQQRILEIIGTVIADTHFPLRFLISSRPEAHIRDFFAKSQCPTLQIDLANVDGAYRDIETYLTSEFARIAVEQGLDPKAWPGQAIIDTLVSKSSGQFVHPSTVIKYVGDKNGSAVARLNVILGLAPCSGKLPFVDLDALYTEILKRQLDQNFLREFLPVLVARSMLVGIEDQNLDDAMLLGLDDKELHRRLRGMHSLLKFEPFVDVHHKSFLDFLLEPSRSGEYYVGKDFANRRYMERITDLLVKAASRAIEQPDSHENDHFKPKFATVIERFPLPIKLQLDEMEEILRPLLIIQDKLLQLPSMSVPWKPRGCDKCWTFYMIDNLVLHLGWFRGAIQLQQQMYVGIRPLTAREERQKIPRLDLDTCLSLLLANLKDVELPLKKDTIGLVRALVHFNPTETAMKVRSITDAQNLVDLICYLNKKKCFKSWFGTVAHNATRLALEICGRMPLLPRSLFLNTKDLDMDKHTYQGKAVKTWIGSRTIREQFFDAFVLGSLSHGNLTPFLGICSDLTDIGSISLKSENGTLRKWRQSTNPSVSKIQQIVFEVAKVIQYVHSLGIMFRFHFSADDVFLDSDNHAKVEYPLFHINYLRDLGNEFASSSFSLENNVFSFGLLFYEVLFNEYYGRVRLGIRPKEPEIADNVWDLIQWCRAKDPKARPTMDQVVQEMESWISLGQFTLSS